MWQIYREKEVKGMVETWAYMLDHSHISTVALRMSLFSISDQKWSACPSSRAVNTSSSSSSVESSELLITAALRAWSSSRTDRSLSDRKQTSGQLNHAAVKDLTLKLGPNRLITMCRLLGFGFLPVTVACRSSFRICSHILTRQSCSVNAGLEQTAHMRPGGTGLQTAVGFLKSTLRGVFSFFLSLGCSSLISLCLCSSSSCFHVARLSNSRSILTTREGADWSHGGTLWSFTVLTFSITAHTPDVTSASCVKLVRAEKACC